ncbi:MAG: hypothetical protein R2795_08190 [Saprospiraceae bacterium]
MDTHLLGLEQLGGHFDFNTSKNIYTFQTKGRLKGCYLHLEEISVTGTANVVMAAVLAEGETTVYNAACEPYVQQLCLMLRDMGAHIEGIGSNRLHIRGVEKLHGTQHKLLPDMIEIGSFIGLAAMTRSEITIKNARIDQLGIIPVCFVNWVLS